jgi:hypothetical protein
VYLRLPEGMVIDDIPPDTLEDAAQITKANSIMGEGGGGGVGLGVRGVDGTGEKQGLCVVLNETEEQGDIMGLDGSRCAQQST